jgi:hypothetical protein
MRRDGFVLAHAARHASTPRRVDRVGVAGLNGRLSDWRWSLMATPHDPQGWWGVLFGTPSVEGVEGVLLSLNSGCVSRICEFGVLHLGRRDGCGMKSEIVCLNHLFEFHV